MTRPVAVLRPEPGNAATADRAAAAGLTVVRLPLFAVCPIDWRPPPAEQFDAVLFTSANAPRHAGTALVRFRALPALAVGKATALAARAAGFDVMTTGDADATALAETAAAQGITRALHLGGQETTIVPGGMIAASIPVYASLPVPVAPAALEALTGTVALLHSARAAARLAELVDAAALPRERIAIAALSTAVAAAAGSGWMAGAIADRPDDAAIIAAARTLTD